MKKKTKYKQTFERAKAESEQTSSCYLYLFEK